MSPSFTPFACPLPCFTPTVDQWKLCARSNLTQDLGETKMAVLAYVVVNQQACTWIVYGAFGESGMLIFSLCTVCVSLHFLTHFL